MQEEFIVTKDFLVESALSDEATQEVYMHFPNGAATIPEFLKKCEELDLYTLAFGVIPLLPQNPELLVLEKYDGGNLFYNGDVYIKNGFECSGHIVCNKLIVDGTFGISEDYHAHANVYAKSVVMKKNALIDGDVFTKLLEMTDSARIAWDVVAKTLFMYKKTLIKGCVKVKNHLMTDDARINENVESETSVMKKNASVGRDVFTELLEMSNSANVGGEVKTKNLVMSGSACVSGRVLTEFISIRDRALVFASVAALGNT